MNCEFNIREVKATDFEWIHCFVNALEETEFEFEVLKTVFLQNINNSNFIYLIAETDHQPIGYISCHSQHLLHHGGQKIGEIQELYVVPEFRNMRIGKQLIEQLIVLAKQKGITQLEVTSNNKRIATHRFYEREQFVQSHKKFTLKI